MCQKCINDGDFIYEITTKRKRFGISSVACIKTFIKPLECSKSNSGIIDNVEHCVKNLVKESACESDLLSCNYIVDFDCTRNNLNPSKWSRLKIDLYLFTQFTEVENELLCETFEICKKVGNLVSEKLSEDLFEKIVNVA